MAGGIWKKKKWLKEELPKGIKKARGGRSVKKGYYKGGVSTGKN